MLSEILRNTRVRRPLVHCITNYVTANDCANLLLGCGASPIMADAPEEVENITSRCDGLVLNLGTPNPRKIEAMALAGRTANALAHPVVFDPVGVGMSDFRRSAARELLRAVRFAVIRGNASEIRTLVHGTTAHRGVDSDADVSEEVETVELAKTLAEHTGVVVLLTGETDIVTDGSTTYRVTGGHPMMRDVTGAGCQLSALVGAYTAANPGETLTATLAASCAMGLCGERAHDRLQPEDGNATYRNYILDALYRLQPEELEKGASYEIYGKSITSLRCDRPTLAR